MQEIVIALIGIILDAVGHTTASEMLSAEAVRRANAAADAVAAAREASDT